MAKASALYSRIYISGYVAQSRHIDLEKKNVPLARTGIDNKSA
jgi:hypothetical protein